MKLFRSNSSALVCLLGAILLVALFVVGCGGDRDRDSHGITDNDYSFDHSLLGCNESLRITDLKGTFPDDATVTFENPDSEQTFDGDAAPIQNNTVLVTGLPSNAPAGTYDVLLNGHKIGQVKNDCESS